MLKQSLSQKMLQKLSPQQIQLMKLLQVPTTSLEERIKEELESNPALEEGDDFNEVIDLEPETEKEEAQTRNLFDTHPHSIQSSEEMIPG